MVHLCVHIIVYICGPPYIVEFEWCIKMDQASSVILCHIDWSTQHLIQY